jgi:hypothetical protein
MPLATLSPLGPMLGRLCSVVVLGLVSCAASGADVHLAPLYTRISTADGGTLVEVAGGLYRQHRRVSDDFLEWATLAPLYGIERQRNGDYVAEHPFLLGRTRHVAGESTSYLVPLYLGWRREEADGGFRSLSFVLPGVIVREKDDETHVGWFPFWGHFENILTFDSATFALWPFYVSNERAERKSVHILWPFFGWTTGGGEKSWHVFPLFARAKWEDRYDRTYALWPIFHWQRNFLGGGGEEPETAWMVFPLVGHKSRGTYRSTMFLWPLFGYARDSESGFWALDAPFFLVRLQRGPDDIRRTRFWPFYGYLYADGQETTSWLWPIFSKRREWNEVFEREGFYAIPFWQTWDRKELATDKTSRWRKLWPLMRYERDGDWRNGALLELDPFFRNTLVPRHVTSFFRLYEWEDDPSFRRERSFLGLYRREAGRGEVRTSVAGLWSRRRYEVDGHGVRETSLLFGLLRWRTSAEGFGMLAPAFPGPGWPRPEDPGPQTESRTYF